MENVQPAGISTSTTSACVAGATQKEELAATDKTRKAFLGKSCKFPTLEKELMKHDMDIRKEADFRRQYSEWMAAGHHEKTPTRRLSRPSLQLVNKLVQLGGRNPNAAVKRMLIYLFADKLATEYSWHGKKGKRKFSDLWLCQHLFTAVRRHFPQSTRDDIESTAKSWLCHAPERANGREGARGM
ncbi:uncharacterized protein LOC142577658 [Dermacentor variabilis]|uniref:uncharacterized protein LOC142577658 n=1 Tax=Dermacentor variabilis TaxID=34621 RepID=UPI003F5B0DE3